jgi:hypothetical protein
MKRSYAVNPFVLKGIVSQDEYFSNFNFARDGTLDIVKGVGVHIPSPTITSPERIFPS